MKKLQVARIIGIAVLFVAALWKQKISYSNKSLQWRIGKSVIDTGLVTFAALKLPALLIGWCVLFLTRSIEKPAIRITLSVVAGIVFSTVGGFALELLCAMGILAVDLLTGQQGVYGWWKQRPPKEFMSWLGDERSQEVSL